MEIRTERLTLRAPRPSDAGLIAMFCADARVARATAGIPHPYPPGAAESYVAAAGPGTFVMDGLQAGLSEVMGVLSLTPAGEDRCEVGFWVAPAFWNTGIASEALAGLIAANPLACRALFATVHQDNPASARVLTQAGFEYIGDAESYSVARDARVPTWTYVRCMT